MLAVDDGVVALGEAFISVEAVLDVAPVVPVEAVDEVSPVVL